MKPETRKTGRRILLVTISLMAILNMLILTGCDLVGNLLGGGNENPTIPTNPAASFKVAITGSPLVDGKMPFGSDFGVKITDNKNPNETISYQWTLDGVPIQGDTKSTHKFVKTDEGKTLGVIVTIKNKTVVATEIAIPKRTITIAFSGTAFDDKGVVGKEGNVIADVSTNWTATDKDGKELTPTLQWTIGGLNIEGANKDNLDLKPEYAGRSLALKITLDGITQTSAALKVPTTSNQTQTITATIMGTPGVGKELTADVQKNFTGPGVKYQWFINNVAVSSLRGTSASFYPEPKDYNKSITLVATCGTVKSAPSQAVTIPSFTYTAEVDWWDENKLYAAIRVGDDGWMATPDQGVTVKWFKNGVVIPGETSYILSVRPEYAGATITAQISGYSQTPTSDGIQILGVQPPPSGISLIGTTWKAKVEGIKEDSWVDDDGNEVNDGYPYEYTFILKFTTYSNWTMNAIMKEGDDEWEGSDEGTYITFTRNDNNIVSLGWGSDSEGVIYSDRIVFPNSGPDGNDVVFTIQQTGR
jgi:hypothetical protein